MPGPAFLTPFLVIAAFGLLMFWKLLPWLLVILAAAGGQLLATVS
jgi:hypothetical protein